MLLAARAGHHEIVDYLLKQGAEIDGTDMLGCTALHHAVRKRSRRTVDAILAYEVSSFFRNGRVRVSNVQFHFGPL